VGDELATQHRQADEAHVNDDRLPRARECRPVEIAGAILQMAGRENAALRVIAVRQRNAGISRDTQRCRDAGDDLEWDAEARQCLDFFAAAAEDEWIAAFQPYDVLALPRKAGEPR